MTAYKNDLTQVNDLVTKLQLPIHFFDSQEPGFAGQRIFVVTLKVGTLCAVGKGNTKKEARARAASIVLGPLKQMYLPPLLSNHQATAKKRNTPEQMQDGKEDINPCGYLSEVVQAYGMKYPEYTLLEATRVPWGWLFTMRVSVQEMSAVATGPTKKAAKNNAAATMLELLGFDCPKYHPLIDERHVTSTKPQVKEEERSQIDFIIDASPEPQSPQHHPWLDMTPTKPEVDKDDTLVSSPVEDRQDICTSPDVIIEEEWEEFLDSDTDSVLEDNETGPGSYENQETRPVAEIYEDTVVSEISIQPEELQEDHIIEADQEPQSPQYHSLVDITPTKPEVDKDDTLVSSPVEDRQDICTSPDVIIEEEWEEYLDSDTDSILEDNETGPGSYENQETRPEAEIYEETVVSKISIQPEELLEDHIIEADPEPESPQYHSLVEYLDSDTDSVDSVLEDNETGPGLYENQETRPEAEIYEDTVVSEISIQPEELVEDHIIEADLEPESPQYHSLLVTTSEKHEVDKDESDTGAEVASASPETSLMESRETDETKPEVAKEDEERSQKDFIIDASLEPQSPQHHPWLNITPTKPKVDKDDFPCPPPILEGPSVASVLVRALVKKLVQKSYFKPEDNGENIRLLLEKTEEHIHHQDVPISLKNMRAVGKAAAKDLLRECRLQGAPLRAEDEVFQKAMVKHLNHCLNKFLFGPQRTGLSRLFAAVGRFFRGS